MGIVIRQSLKSTIISYAGVIIGGINTLVLFPRFLEPEEFGLTRVLLSISLLVGQFAEFGGTNVINKYFPFFRDERETLKRFIFWVFLKSFLAYAFIAFFVYIFREQILDGYSARSELVVHFFGYIFPLALFMLFFNLLEAYARSLYRIVVPNILREVYLRITVLVIILLYHFEIITFEQFIMLFAASYASATLLIALYVAWLDRNFITPSLSFRKHTMMREVFVYGLYSILTVAVWRAVSQLDIIMLSYLDTLEGVAVYSIVFYLVTLIQLPQRFLHQISNPLVAEHLKHNNLTALKELYQKVGLNQYIIGIFLFAGIWINMDNLYHFLPEEYHGVNSVILILTFGRLFDMATSINGEIIVYSSFYKFNLWAGIVLVVISIATNFFFIPLYGIFGAALATSISLIVFNSMRILFVYLKFGIIPFQNGMITATLIGFAILLINYFLPVLDNKYIDFIYRSSVITFVFLALILRLKVSLDIYDFFQNFSSKVLKTISQLKRK